ncbi:sulfatase-like hydrolase/transferase [Opitutia bacterium ISCC 51]|nr:sulfatase-like hydrolase/transferase [Opitutae bacterium ISCC 51]QXD30125.1 sulfatase-like hydrolase/transferase [Opitutae bacterium ISCC 52]
MHLKYVILFCSLLGSLAAADKPNVIFLMADDLGYGDVGFNGNSLVKTPNLDRMAGDGLRFTRFYSVGPVCSPTRACVQTGRHSMRFGMIGVNIGKLPTGEINMAQIAKSQAYRTGHFGKWHLGTLTKDPELSGPVPATTAERYGPPWERHYDVTFATETNIATWDPLDETGLRMPKHRVHFWSNGTEVKEDWKGSSEKMIMDRALEFVEDSAQDENAFLATIWFYGPHSPTRAGEELRALYPNEKLGRQHYLGSITSIDNEVGRLRQTLEELGIEQNTLIFFCSDNGPEGTGTPEPEYNTYGGVYYGEAGEFKGRKRYLYNGGVCVPAFAYWPGVIDVGQSSDEPVCSLDYLPTLCAVLGIEPPNDRPMDGTNVLDLLKGEDWRRNKFIPFASNMQKKSPTASIISQGHKLLLWFDESKKDELYNLKEDPKEETNLYQKNPILAGELRLELMTWLKSARHSYDHGDYPGYQVQGQFIKVE